MLVLPGWALLLFLPRWEPATTLVTAIVIPALLALLYLWLLAVHWPGSNGGLRVAGGSSALFGNEFLLLAGYAVSRWKVAEFERLTAIGLAAVLYSGGLLLFFWQAINGKPLL